VTGQVVRIDLRPGTADIVNAGHPLPCGCATDGSSP
jgi:hypothetical protein